MAKDNPDHIEMDGEIVDVGAGGNFRVQISESGHVVIARLAGKLRQNKIRVVLGDKVKVKISPYDSTRGIISYRGR